jgi:4-amino-4-deoxy-L-arabinose transferase-like glycosyltransferase
MIFDARPSPARVSAAAAAPLPRWALWALLAAYGLAGLFGRDPWFQDDAAGFGLMWTIARGTLADWLLPNVLGAAVAEEGPLPFWVGALFIKTLGPWLGDAFAARLTCLLWLLVGTASIWYATYRLARRDEAQPVAFVFGGEANARDYGRMQADIAVLLALGTIGIAPRLHEITAETAAVALLAAMLYGLARALDDERAGTLIAALALGALALTRGVVPALFALAAVVVVAAARGRWRMALAITGVAAALFALWPLAAYALAPQRAPAYFAAWIQWNAASLTMTGAPDLARIARNFPWYAWPLWPLAAWAVYSWRQSLRAPHVVVPGALAALMLARLFLTGTPSEEKMILAVPPLVLLAAFGITTLPRAARNAFDWFAIAVASFVAVAVWSYYVAVQTGVPPKMARSIVRLTPGFAHDFVPAALALALAVTAAWIALLVWRVRARPPVLWRGAVLNAAGLTMLWVVLNALFMGAFNYSRTYAPLAQQVGQQVSALGAGECVVAHRLLPAHRALFAWHGGLRFVAPDLEAACPVALHRDLRRSRLDDEPPPGDWSPVWEGAWPARPDEVFRLYRRGR